MKNQCRFLNPKNRSFSQVTFIYISTFIMQIVLKQLYSNNRKIMQQVCFGCTAALEENSVIVQL